MRHIYGKSDRLSPRGRLLVEGKTDFEYGGAERCKGKCYASRLKRGESIQLLVAPLLGIEVARLEITWWIVGVDRLNKRYVNVSFEELSRLANTDLSFNILQSLFLE